MQSYDEEQNAVVVGVTSTSATPATRRRSKLERMQRIIGAKNPDGRNGLTLGSDQGGRGRRFSTGAAVCHSSATPQQPLLSRAQQNRGDDVVIDGNGAVRHCT